MDSTYKEEEAERKDSLFWGAVEKKAAAGRIVVLEAAEDSLFEARRRSADDVMVASIYSYCVVDVSLQKKTDVTRSTL